MNHSMRSLAKVLYEKDRYDVPVENSETLSAELTEYRRRVNPYTIMAVLDALNSCMHDEDDEGNEEAYFDQKAVNRALRLLEGEKA